jgi:hypothetical protein
MKANNPTEGFWAVLAMVNALALIYPISLLLRANCSVNPTSPASMRT